MLARQPAEGLAGDLNDVHPGTPHLFDFLTFFHSVRHRPAGPQQCRSRRRTLSALSVSAPCADECRLSRQRWDALEPTMPLLLVLLEIPAILLRILLARGLKAGPPCSQIAREVLLGRSALLLVGGLFVGWAAGPARLEPMASLFSGLFDEIFALFLA